MPNEEVGEVAWWRVATSNTGQYYTATGNSIKSTKKRTKSEA